MLILEYCCTLTAKMSISAGVLYGSIVSSFGVRLELFCSIARGQAKVHQVYLVFSAFLSSKK